MITRPLSLMLPHEQRDEVEVRVDLERFGQVPGPPLADVGERRARRRVAADQQDRRARRADARRSRRRSGRADGSRGRHTPRRAVARAPPPPEPTAVTPAPHASRAAAEAVRGAAVVFDDEQLGAAQPLVAAAAAARPSNTAPPPRRSRGADARRRRPSTRRLHQPEAEAGAARLGREERGEQVARRQARGPCRTRADGPSRRRSSTLTSTGPLPPVTSRALPTRLPTTERRSLSASADPWLARERTCTREPRALVARALLRDDRAHDRLERRQRHARGAAPRRARSSAGSPRMPLAVTGGSGP